MSSRRRNRARAAPIALAAAIAAIVAVLALAHECAGPVHAAIAQNAIEPEDFASPLELLFSPDADSVHSGLAELSAWPSAAG